MDLSKLTTKQFNQMVAENGRKTRAEFLKMSKDPMHINEALLLQILQDSKDTEYGKKYDFATIDSIQEYQKRVPVTEYADYATYMQRTVYKNENNLLTSYPFELFCQSSGTMGIPKILPMSQNSIDVHKTWNTPIYYGVVDEGLDDNGAWQEGRALVCMSCGLTSMKYGKKFGALSSIMMEAMRPFLSVMTSTPEESMFPNGLVDTRYLQARFALMDKGISVIQSTFLCYAVETIRYIQDNWKMLVKDIETGTIDASISLPEDTVDSLMKKITPMPERANELRKVFEESLDGPFLTKIWPSLRIVSGGGTGAFEMYAELLRERYIDDNVKLYYSGLNSTEALFSIPLELECKDSAIVPCSIFYEFLPIDAGNDFSKIVTLDNVEVGKDYEIILTNMSGLYRYRMRDCIRVMGFLDKLPLIRFQYRIEQTLDIMGDHTTEASLTLFARQTAKELGFELLDYAVYPDRNAEVPKYVYFMEIDKLPQGVTRADIQKSLWTKLKDGVYFLTSKFEEGRCTVDIHILQRETFWLYRDLQIMRGAAPSQVKPLRIVTNESQFKFLSQLVEAELE